jgi:NADPH-dependent curcumin reductase CurA
MPMNDYIVLKSRPQGQASVENFELCQAPVPALQEGQVLVRHQYLSLDPYMRGRMNEGKSYAAPQALGEVMLGSTVGLIEASRHLDFAVGDAVLNLGGWQTYSVVDAGTPGTLHKLDTRHIPISAYLGTVGMPGVTAWYGLNQILQPQAGQTVVVSAASGAVGSVVGALAKQLGCRTVGIAGGPDKCRYVVEELGLDACVDYKAHGDAQALSTALKSACPQGIDGYFDNVGGPVLDAVMLRMNPFGRIAVCGRIASYEGVEHPMRYPSLILVNRLLVQGFIVSDHMDWWPQALRELGEGVLAGRLPRRESVAQGLAAAPAAFIGLLKGHHFGKQLVRL